MCVMMGSDVVYTTCVCMCVMMGSDVVYTARVCMCVHKAALALVHHVVSNRYNATAQLVDNEYAVHARWLWQSL
jgi:hypothetical protein